MQTIVRIRLIFLILMMTTLYACESGSWSCLRGNGIKAEETRDLDFFNRFSSEGDYDIVVISDTVYSIHIETDENLIPYIRTRISGTHLVIDQGTRKCLRPELPILVTIRVPEVHLMELVGSGQITADNLNTNELRAEISGSGRIDLRGLDVGILEGMITGQGDLIFWGDAVNADFDITGSGLVDAYNLTTRTCIASISGSGNMQVNVERHLDVNISGSGNIYYRGNPSVSTNISGSGSVINDNK